ncbi:MAG: DUF1573 domain-containing protein, partial [Bacteroidota bacterium]
MSTQPDTVKATLICEDSTTVPLNILNTGGSDLIATLDADTLFAATSDVLFTTTGENTQHDFTGLPVLDSLQIVVTLNGDYDGPTEFATLFVDGDSIGVINDGDVFNGANALDTFIFGGAQAANFLADGQVNVTVDNNFAVNVGVGGLSLNRVQVIVPGVPWMAITPAGGTIPAGDSLATTVALNSTGLLAGQHLGNVLVSSNDPLNPQLLVPVELNVAGIPVTVLSDTCLAIDSTIELLSRSDTFQVSNTGCADLLIDSITNSLPEFTLSVTSDTLAPNDSVEIVVTFSPLAPGLFHDTLRLFTNEGDTTICLSGLGVPRPGIVLDQDSFQVTVPGCCDSAIVTLQVGNNGLNNLAWNVFAADTLGDDFEPGIDSTFWDTIIGAAASNACGVAAGTNALFFNGSTRVAETRDLSVSNGGTVDFQLLIGTGAGLCEAADAGEDIVLEYSLDSGATWVLINTYTTALFPAFTLVQEPIPAAAQGSRTRFRWRQLAFDEPTGDNWSLDNIAIGVSNFLSFNPTSGTTPIGDSTAVSVVIDGCNLAEGEHRQEITVTSNDPLNPLLTVRVRVTKLPLPPAPMAADTAICLGDPVPPLTATGDSIRWYSDGALTMLEHTGATFATGDSVAGVFTYFVTQTPDSCESPA